ncbi:helix-turn-helix domain-containing protein [Thermomonospora umbrina]|uniref:Excisionase family DNA binding protein n=1 Tax=Thermomonospora umbrina TaxID=111806 RepID=A0A3D9SX15_9ACTN|nr:helix-turn-helix domain-containing protein [Thermomonospora umbrina]REF00487.1 hypothetical protein DFJ69_6030 [Thermomonospora umbrina]
MTADDHEPPKRDLTRDPDVLTADELANKWGLGAPAIRKMAQAGTIPALRTAAGGSGRWLFHYPACIAALATASPTPPSEPLGRGLQIAETADEVTEVRMLLADDTTVVLGKLPNRQDADRFVEALSSAVQIGVISDQNDTAG